MGESKLASPIKDSSYLAIVCPVQYLCVQYAKHWLHFDIRSCCCQSVYAFTSSYKINYTEFLRNALYVAL